MRGVELRGIDDQGRPALHPISPFRWVETAAVAGVRLRLVPSEFWTQDADDDGREVGIVACPCGHSPRVPSLELLACECQRVYFNGVQEIWSLNVPGRSLPDESPAEA